jgi:hypothetical protein
MRQSDGRGYVAWAARPRAGGSGACTRGQKVRGRSCAHGDEPEGAANARVEVLVRTPRLAPRPCGVAMLCR